MRQARRAGHISFERSFEINPETRLQNYDHRKERLLKAAARVFAANGFASTSMRDLARAAGMSLAGLYYYCEGKDDLLYQIQKACFESVSKGAAEVVRRASGPEEKLAAFISHHVHFFVSHMGEMKVLAHEAESLSGEMLKEITRLKRGYVDMLVDLLAALDGASAEGRARRQIAAYTLFGMMNWIYTWYHPGGAASVHELSDTITRLFLNGYQVEVSAS
ncbi:MAG TPA: TetR/AcrR family transcriptional regulator [Gemmatimonadales bacterium]